MNTGDDGRLTLTPEEAFALIGCGRTLGYELIRLGRLPHVRLSVKKIVIPRKALEKMLEDLGVQDSEQEVGP
jgi:excisionase family DNA binding protein